MYIIPSIDLKDGQCVRLRKGEFDTVHRVAEDALETARRFEADGAEFLHMVDLDGALRGDLLRDGLNYDMVSKAADQTNLKIELGGGLRDMDSLKRADSMGVYRMVIGSAAVGNPDFVAEAVGLYGDRIAIGIDAKDGIVKTSGWVESSGVHYIDFAKQVESLGVKYIIFTDIDRDGMLSGPSLDSLKRLIDAVSCNIIASGGISSIDDLKAVKELGLYGAIVGKAVYTGDVSLKEAIAACK
jgi:phosphoribosylformimino-5-aminoimidazole carboxamide ribotide isomerase